VSAIASRTICWEPVHDYVEKLASRLGVDLRNPMPFPGTLAWLALPDDSPVKKSALLLAASQRVLHLEVEQENRADASKDVAAAADWPAIANEVRSLADARKSGARIERWRAS